MTKLHFEAGQKFGTRIFQKIDNREIANLLTIYAGENLQAVRSRDGLTLIKRRTDIDNAKAKKAA